MTGTDALVGIVIAVGLVGVLVPVLPGSLLVGAAVAYWAVSVATPAGWVVLGVAVALLLLGAVVKYVVPGRRLRRDGIPTSTLVLGGVLGVVGFFVVPVVGLPIGFVLGVYLAELRRRRDHTLARAATRRALGQVGVSILIELAACLGAAAAWAVGVVAP